MRPPPEVAEAERAHADTAEKKLEELQRELEALRRKPWGHYRAPQEALEPLSRSAGSPGATIAHHEKP